MRFERRCILQNLSAGRKPFLRTQNCKEEIWRKLKVFSSLLFSSLLFSSLLFSSLLFSRLVLFCLVLDWMRLSSVLSYLVLFLACLVLFLSCSWLVLSCFCL